jgi:hypothetical protein
MFKKNSALAIFGFVCVLFLVDFKTKGRSFAVEAQVFTCSAYEGYARKLL